MKSYLYSMVSIVDGNLRRFLATFFDSSQLSQLLHALSRPPLRTTVRVVGSSDEATLAALHELQQTLPADLAATATVHAVLPHCLQLQLQDRSLHVRPHATRPAVVVDARCGTAVLRGADVFAPGVLGLSPGVHVGDAVSVWLDAARQHRTRRGAAVDAAAVGARCVFLGHGELAMSRRAVFAADTRGVAVRVTDPVFQSVSLSSFDALGGRLFLQNDESIVAALALGAQPGELVLDMCAAPGGKACHLAELVRGGGGGGGGGTVVAVDRSRPKTERLLANCERFACHNVRVLTLDALQLALGAEFDGERVAADGTRVRERVRLDRAFDRILLDAPCSGLGQRPRFSIEEPLAALLGLARQQQRLLQHACTLLRPGGRLVFSTCSFMPSENEANVQALLSAVPSMRLVAALPRVGDAGLPGFEFDSQLVQRWTPGVGAGDGIGFFVACFEKAE